MSDIPQKDAMPEYQARKTAAIIQVFSMIVMCAGVVSILVCLYYLIAGKSDSATRLILVLSGIGAIIIASFFYVFANLSEDLHKLHYDYEYISLKNAEFQHRLTEHMREIDNDHDAIKMALAMISSKTN